MNNSLIDSKNKKFGIYEAALATILYIVFNAVFIWGYRLLPSSFRQADSFWYYLASFLIEALFGLTAYVVAVTRKTKFVSAVGADKKINSDVVFYSILISFVCLIFFGNITDSFIELLSLFGYSSVLGTIKIDNFGIYLVYVITTCLAPALFEEILFRGTIASGLKEKGFKVALFGSAVIFTLMHGNPEQTVHQFIIGLLIGYIFLKTGNIWAGVIIHFVNNFSAVTMLYIGGLIYGDELYETSSEVADVTVGSFIINLIVAIAFAVIGYAIVKRLIAKVCKASEIANSGAVKVEENSTIKVDDAEVAVQMTVDGEEVNQTEEQTEKQTEENLQENLVNASKEKEIKGLPVSVIVMFALSGAYFAFEWIGSLLIGLGLL